MAYSKPVVVILDVNYCLFLCNGRWDQNVAGSGKRAELSDNNYKALSLIHI